MLVQEKRFQRFREEKEVQEQQPAAVILYADH